MYDALIGSTGFVGSSLHRQHVFEGRFHSRNISEIVGPSWQMVVCAGAPGQKWVANENPTSDSENLQNLTGHLEKLKCRLMILISTVDVYASPQGIVEGDSPAYEQAPGYGANRLALESFVVRHFPNHLIVRLPALVGGGLRKNAIFDLAHNNQVDRIPSGAYFQFYPMERLMADIQIALASNLKLIHLCAEPVAIDDIAKIVFSRSLQALPENTKKIQYDMRTKYGSLFNSQSPYQYDRTDVLQACMRYRDSVKTMPLDREMRQRS